ncbi:unnamed protein product [Nesidiocoris tenuis]|uniref:PHD-type domain-containing protein n=1 Tax=Nesidiocoris tenuis TaxID=355587 RepID=A0A6H5H3X0_9HEMI|nr:unnamed protein product [Nesidiocoris tenuis]
MECAKCDSANPPADPVKCATCAQRFHASCTRLESLDKWTRMSYEKREAWRCDLCRHSDESPKPPTEPPVWYTSLLSDLHAIKNDLQSVRSENDQLKSQLAKCSDDHSKWAAKLHLTQISLNSAINETTKFTPAELFLGRNISTPLNFMWGVSEKELDLPHTWTTAINNIHREHSRYAKFYNRKHTNVTYAVGDHVYLKTHILSDKIKRITHKLAPKYYGPFTIIKLLSPVTYVLQDTKNPNLVKTAHVSQLKIAREQRRAPS